MELVICISRSKTLDDDSCPVLFLGSFEGPFGLPRGWRSRRRKIQAERGHPSDYNGFSECKLGFLCGLASDGLVVILGH